jgi:hypothetical protein
LVGKPLLFFEQAFVVCLLGDSSVGHASFLDLLLQGPLPCPKSLHLSLPPHPRPFQLCCDVKFSTVVRLGHGQRTLVVAVGTTAAATNNP